MVQAFICKEDGVFDEDSTGSQDEREEQVDVDVVPGAVKLSAEDRALDGQTVWGRGLRKKLPSASEASSPEDGEDEDGHDEGDEGGGIASRVDLLVVGEVGRLQT